MKVGPQIERHLAAPFGGATTLTDPSRADVLAGVRELLLSRGPEYADAAWNIAHRPGVLDELVNIKVPVVVVAGTEDATYPPEKSEQGRR